MLACFTSTIDLWRPVDAHTARHLYINCLKGDLMRGRTIILVSHHVQLCAPGAQYIVSLDNGRVQYSGDYSGFQRSDLLQTLVYANALADVKTNATTDSRADDKLAGVAEELTVQEPGSTAPSTAPSDVLTVVDSDVKPTKKPPRKLVEDEKRAVGGINKDIWTSYLAACGSWPYWLTFAVTVGLGAAAPVFENTWLRCVVIHPYVTCPSFTSHQDMVEVLP